MKDDQKAVLDVLSRVVLRRAWVSRNAGAPVRLRDATELIQEARRSVGLPAYRGGAASDFIQRNTDGYKLNEGNPVFKKTDGGGLEPLAKDWERDWRTIFAPDHSTVRELERNGELVRVPHATDPTIRYRFVPMDPSYPEADIIVTNREDARPALTRFANSWIGESSFEIGVPSLYFFHADPPTNKIYVGQTDEPSTRVGSPNQRPFLWHVLIVRAKEEGAMTTDVLKAAEALAIMFWGEISHIANGKGGADKIPSRRSDLREATSFASVASAALLGLHRIGDLGGIRISIPFKDEIAETYLEEQLT